MKGYKYDYTELEKFIEEEHPQKEILAGHFVKLCNGYMKMATFILSGRTEVKGYLTVDVESADFVEQYLTIFQILGRLPKVKEGGES